MTSLSLTPTSLTCHRSDRAPATEPDPGTAYLLTLSLQPWSWYSVYTGGGYVSGDFNGNNDVMGLR